MEIASTPIIVRKYGGSSVADPDKIKIVAMHIAEAVKQGMGMVVVVSAMGKATDELLRLAHQVSTSPVRRELDMLLSTGERISMTLLAMALHDLGVDAISFTGSQSGILTNDRHSGAKIIEVRPVRIEDELARGKVVIVAGFQGMSYKREITTLGRGGSDTTAVALAAALSAIRCEIYSDVDGVYSADPRVVKDAQHLPEVSYDEMIVLAEAGAKVLNAEAVRWAQRAGVVIHARKTGSDERETVVVPRAAAPSLAGHANAVSGTPQVLHLHCFSHGDEILSLLQREGACIRSSQCMSIAAEIQLDVDFTKENMPNFDNILNQVKAIDPLAQLQEDLGCVTVIGPGVSSIPLSSLLSALAPFDIKAQRVQQSPLQISIYMSQPHVDQATILLHDLLVLRACDPFNYHTP